MTPLKIALVGMLGIGVAASLAFADHKPNHPGGGDTGGVTGTWVFAGYSSIPVRGDATLKVIYEMCQVDFGDNARMALMEEWVKSPNITLPIADVWIQRVTAGTQDPFAPNQQTNCDGWAVGEGASGSVLQTNGRLETSSCATPLAVACVVPQ